jgi:CPA2 family monovalent cation:H+ antiporter-2
VNFHNPLFLDQNGLMTSLELTLLYLLAAVLGVVGCRLLKFPPMLGYLLVGILIGPNALALAQNSESIRHLAEFGVVFLCLSSNGLIQMG